MSAEDLESRVMSVELSVVPTNQAVAERPTSGLALSFTEMTMRVAQLDQFYRDVMQEGTDYGVIPGTQKPSLFQPGAQLLDQIFGYVPTFEVMPSSTVDWDRPIPFFHYVVRCTLQARRTGESAAEGIGSANSHEDRYRWRQSKKVCPKCGIEAIGRSKAEYGGGYFCNAKQGGCGARYRQNSREAADLDQQASGRVENEDTASLENTLLKMAQKRAHVAATLNGTGASRIFTQDIEDLPQFQQARVVEAMSEAVAPTEASPVAVQQQQPDPTPVEEERAREAVGKTIERLALEQAYARLAAQAVLLKHPRADVAASLDISSYSDKRLRATSASLETWIKEQAEQPAADEEDRPF